MKINVDRLCQLAGVGGKSSGILRESTHDVIEEEAAPVSDMFAEAMEDEKDLDETMHSSMEGDYHEEGMDHEEAMHYEEGMGHEEGMYHEEDMHEGVQEENLDEVIEIDEVELVQELRRMKRLMNENKRRQAVEAQKAQAARKQALQEAHLRSVIEEEVQNIMDELNLSSDWIYGENQPKKSRKGFVHQGSFLKGIGFK